MAKKHLAGLLFSATLCIPLIYLLLKYVPVDDDGKEWQEREAAVHLLAAMNDRAHWVWIESGNRLQAEWVITAAASVAPAARAAPSCKTLWPAFPPCQISPAHLPAVARSLHFLPVLVPPPVLFFLSCPWAGNMALADQLPSQRTL